MTPLTESVYIGCHASFYYICCPVQKSPSA